MLKDDVMDDAYGCCSLTMLIDDDPSRVWSVLIRLKVPKVPTWHFKIGLKLGHPFYGLIIDGPCLSKLGFLMLTYK